MSLCDNKMSCGLTWCREQVKRLSNIWADESISQVLDSKTQRLHKLIRELVSLLRLVHLFFSFLLPKNCSAPIAHIKTCNYLSSQCSRIYLFLFHTVPIGSGGLFKLFEARISEGPRDVCLATRITKHTHRARGTDGCVKRRSELGERVRDAVRDGLSAVAAEVCCCTRRTGTESQAASACSDGHCSNKASLSL